MSTPIAWPPDLATLMNAKADACQNAGGNRDAYIAGWMTCEAGDDLMTAMHRWGGVSGPHTHHKSFIIGADDCDCVLTAISVT